MKPSDFHIFTLNDSTVGVESDLLSEALRNLTDVAGKGYGCMRTMQGWDSRELCQSCSICL